MGQYRRRRKNYSVQILWIVVAVIATAGLLIGYKLGKSDHSDDAVVNAAGNDKMITLTPTTEVAITQEPTVEPAQETQPTVTVEPTAEPTPQGPYKINESNTSTDTVPDNGTDTDTNHNNQKEGITTGNSSSSVGIDEEPTKEPTEEPTKEPTEEVQKMVALTFDDGPYPPVTNRLLKLLKDNDSRATFFVVGNRMDTYPDTVKEVFEAGHQIGNHTLNHKNLTKLSAKDIKYEVERSNELINENADVGTGYIRPPYGAKSDDVKKNVNAPLIFWSVDSEDWKSKNKDAIYNMIMSNVKDGDIILMHDLYPTTADAMEKVIPELIRQGYKLVTVQELLEAKGITPEAGSVYYNAR